MDIIASRTFRQHFDLMAGKSKRGQTNARVPDADENAGRKTKKHRPAAPFKLPAQAPNTSHAKSKPSRGQRAAAVAAPMGPGPSMNSPQENPASAQRAARVAARAARVASSEPAIRPTKERIVADGDRRRAADARKAIIEEQQHVPDAIAIKNKASASNPYFYLFIYLYVLCSMSHCTLY